MENAYVLQLSDSKFKDLFLCFCGYAQCQPLHSFGPAARPNYIIHFILDGKGIYQVGEKKYELQAGQGFLIEPEVLTFYQADDTEPWTYLWVGFGGNRAKEYVSDIGLNSNQLSFQSENGKELKQLVLKMLKNNNSSSNNQYLLQSILLEFFYVLTKDIEIERKDEKTKESLYVEQAVKYIRNNYSKPIKVADIASYVCVNRSYLYKMFEKSLEMSPQEFLSRFRISRAKELLTVTELSIEEIAISCGYSDALVFSKSFKKQMGVPPSVYRREHTEEVRKRLKECGKNIEQLYNETF
ncbi:MAG: AraC family transcriptional regulator [Eubacterium sp.]|nr:AraC family transcriptional regulator [Eubacterium sp.]